MHQEFYGNGKHKFPGAIQMGTEDDLFYCMVVRTVLGWHMSTKDGTTNHAVYGDPIWVNEDDKRELQEVGSTKYRYNSLIAESGRGCLLKRFREFMVYHESQCYIEYIIAYKRKSKR